MKVYFMGNSFTMEAAPARVQELVKTLGVDMDFAAQLSGGKNLTRQVNSPKETDQWFTPSNFGGKSERTGSFGKWDPALTEYKWDAVVLQLFANTLHDDLAAISTIIDTTAKNGTVDKFFLYSTWPGRPRPQEGDYALAKFDYSAAWEAEYPASAEATGNEAKAAYASASYVDKLYAALLEKYPALQGRLFVVPVGEVLHQLDKQIKAGELPEIFETARREGKLVPGYREGHSSPSEGAGILYFDPLHLKGGVGTMVSSTTLATVLSGKSPVGLGAKPFAMDAQADAELLRKVQETIWKVVTSDPRTGVTKP